MSSKYPTPDTLAADGEPGIAPELPPSDSEQQVAMGQKIAWGLGGAVDNIMANGIAALALPIYNISLGVSPVLLGWALALPRVFDALIDPFIGNMSDNTRSRWGRRRPFIVVGAVLCALFFTLIWTPPLGLSHTGLFIYFLVMSLFYYLGYALFIIPRTALGYELSTDYHERTSIFAYNTAFAYAAGLLIPWLYKLSFHDIFGGDERIGVRYVAVGTSLVVLACALAPALFTRERQQVQAQPKIELIKAVRLTIVNRPFLLMAGILVFILLGVLLVGPMNLYINICYICGGSKEVGAYWGGWVGTTQAIAGGAAIVPIAWLARHIGKKQTMLLGQALAVTGFISSWFCFTPAHPALQIIPTILYVPGLTCVWVLSGSILADICDDDELKNGLRREGMFGAVFAFISKTASASITIVAGYILVWAGYSEGVDQQTPQTLVNLRLLFMIVPIVFLGIAAWCTIKFPITEQTARQVRAQLDARQKESSSSEDENSSPLPPNSDTLSAQGA